MDESKEVKNNLEQLKRLTSIIPQVVETLLPVDEVFFTSFIGAVTDSYCEEHNLDAVQILNNITNIHIQMQEILNADVENKE